MWQNARYLTWNDKGGVGELTVTSVASKSAAGGSVTFSNDGTIRFNPKAGWQGKDWVEYTVKDSAGNVDTGKFYVQVGKRSEEHTSELQSLMRNSYAVFCLKKKTPIHCSYTDSEQIRHTQ